MARNIQASLDLQAAALEVLREVGKVEYPAFLGILKERGLEAAIPFLPGMRKVTAKYSLVFNPETNEMTHYIEPISQA